MSRSRVLWCAGLLLLLAVSRPVAGCLWDTDTLAMERRTFPDILELITGKFLRHSTEFYQWRIKDRLARIESEPNNLALYDDLAVAYDKTGEHQLAIATMQRKEAIKPGLYETAANLGTFHIHAGDLEAGIPFLKQAIEINPDAHFGREIYQVVLVQYVLEHKPKDGPLKLPLQETLADGYPMSNFGRFMVAQLDSNDEQSEIKAGIQGIAGMMRFGNHNSPVLLEALGDLLVAQNHPADARRMAARCYLRASQMVEDKQAKEEYRALARKALGLQLDGLTRQQLDLNTLEQRLAAELQEADQWYAQVRADELKWIADGADVDQEFGRKYYRQPVVGSNAQALMDLAAKVLVAAAVLSVSLIVLGFWLRRRQRRKPEFVVTADPQTTGD